MRLENKSVRDEIHQQAYDANNMELKERGVYKFYKREFKMSLKRAHLNALIISAAEDKGINTHSLMDVIIFTGPMTSGTIEEYMSSILKVYKGKTDILNLQEKHRVSNILSHIFDGIAQWGLIHGHKTGISVSILNLIEAAEKYPEFGDIIMNDHFTPTMDVRDMYELKNSLEKKTLELIKKHKIEPFYSGIFSGGGMKIPQLMDVLIGVGLRPNGETIGKYPVPEKLLNGYTTIGSEFVENSSAREALILTKIDITDTGVLLKDALGAANTVYVNGVEDCGSVHTTPYFIKDEKALKKVIGLNREHKGKHHPIHSYDTDLIGEWVSLRTPMTCACQDGICQTCAGEFSEVFPKDQYIEDFDKEISLHMGVHIILTLLGPEGQSFLSAKHHVKAVIDDFEILLDNGQIEEDVLKLEYNKIVFKNKIKEIVPLQMDGRDIIRARIVVNKNESFEIELDNPKCWFYTTSPAVVGEKIDGDLYVRVFNNKLGSRFREIQSIYRSKSSKVNTYLETHFNEFLKIFSKEHVLSASVLTRMVLRDHKETAEFPDFTDPNVKVVAMPMTDILKSHKSLSLRLSIGYGSTIFNNPFYYSDETHDSQLDDMIIR